MASFLTDRAELRGESSVMKEDGSNPYYSVNEEAGIGRHGNGSGKSLGSRFFQS